MRDALFILFVVFILAALTALRYRKQISAVIRISRMLREGPQNDRQIPTMPKRGPMEAEPLVKCSRCGTWVPENRSRRIRSGDFFCSAECFELGAKTAGNALS